LAMSLTSSVFGMRLKKSSGVAEHVWRKMVAFIVVTLVGAVVIKYRKQNVYIGVNIF
jgi:hypothetical protein